MVDILCDRIKYQPEALQTFFVFYVFYIFVGCFLFLLYYKRLFACGILLINQKRGEAPFLVSSFVNESSSYSHVKIVPLQSGSSG